MRVSVLIPAYRASQTLGATLHSIFVPFEGQHDSSAPEVIVVDDGSPDGAELRRVCDAFPSAKLVVQPKNGGRLAAINAGAGYTRGEIVMILDADDTLVPDWPAVLRRIVMAWPAAAPVCYSACRNQLGRSTVAEPTYQGPLTLLDVFNERYSGEYLVLTRGDVLRTVGYVPIPGLAACEALSYIKFTELAPCWITPEVLRIYHEGRTGSLSSGWGEPAKAEQMVRCYEALFARYGRLYAELAPRAWRSKRLRFAVYLMMAGRGGAWQVWWDAAGLSVWRESLGSLLMCMVGRRMTVRLVAWLKQLGLVRRYG